ncbi:MAG: hypothetical protein SF069_10065 [Phycisphaerae bacterium]|nr:hypothetical protein [Phycisphaerae bacterium]
MSIAIGNVSNISENLILTMMGMPMYPTKLLLVATISAALLVGSVALTPAPSLDQALPDRRIAALQRAWRARTLRAVDEYRRYDRVSDNPNRSPLNCMILPLFGAHSSRSGDAATHGEKLYYLFAKDAEAYFTATKFGMYAFDPPIDAPDQFLVKESWIAEKCAPPPPGPDSWWRPVPEEYTRSADGWLRTGKFHGLFLMLRVLPSATPGTDEGWVYATVDSDRKTILEFGLIESCMKCHEAAPHGRLFGLPQGRPTHPRPEGYPRRMRTG